MTLISRVLGFIRDVVVARTFGAGEATDAFFVAFKLPNLFRRLFGEGALATAFVPVFTKYRQRYGSSELCGLFASVTGVLMVVVGAITVLGVAMAPVLVWIIAPGFGDDPERQELAVELIRITFPYLFCISLVALSGGALNSLGRFAPPAFTPVLLNVAMIGSALWWAPYFSEPIKGLAWGVLVGGVVQLLFQGPYLSRLRLLSRPRFRPRDPGVRQIVQLMGPTALGAGVTQFGILIDTLLASLLAGGSISYLYYSDRLVQFPLGLFGIALGTAILPTLSTLVGRGEEAAYSDTLDGVLRLIVTVGVPTTAALITLGQPILATLFQYGEFTPAATAATYPSLVAYSVGLLGFMGVKVLTPAFYARQQPRTPVRIAVQALAANIVLSLILIVPLAYAGLALATSLAALLNAGLLLQNLRRAGLYTAQPGWGGYLVKVILAGIALVVAGWWVSPAMAVWDQTNVWGRVGYLTTAILVAGGTYLVSAWLLGIEEVRRGPRWLWEQGRDAHRGIK